MAQVGGLVGGVGELVARASGLVAEVSGLVAGVNALVARVIGLMAAKGSSRCCPVLAAASWRTKTNLALY